MFTERGAGSETAAFVCGWHADCEQTVDEAADFFKEASDFFKEAADCFEKTADCFEEAAHSETKLKDDEFKFSLASVLQLSELL
jgi:hypothetical protein